MKKKWYLYGSILAITERRHNDWWTVEEMERSRSRKQPIITGTDRRSHKYEPKNQNSSKNSFLPFLCRLSFDVTTNAAPYTCVLHTAQTASHGWQHICYVLIGHGMSADKKQIYSCHIINRIAQIVDIKTINGLLVTTTMATGQDCLRGSQTHPTDVIPNWCDQPAMLRKPQSSWEKENEADTPNNERFRFNIGI